MYNGGDAESSTNFLQFFDRSNPDKRYSDNRHGEMTVNLFRVSVVLNR